MPVVLSLIVHTEGDPLEKASWIASGLGFIVAAGALVVSALANRANNQVQRATFWLDIRKMFADHNNVFGNLQEGGPWHQSDTEPSTPEDRARVVPYLSLLEQVKFMLDKGLIDKETIDATLISYRVRLILQNGPIKRDLLHNGHNDEKPEWQIFKELVDYFDQRYCEKHDFDYRGMYDSKVGGDQQRALFIGS